jgi:hypothetical protein
MVRVSRVTWFGVMRCRVICRRTGGDRRSTSIDPVPAGQPVVPEAAVTTAVWADWTEFEPVVFDAVTVTRIERPESALTSA